MIQVYTNKENYQYDLHSLIKAFYPERDVKVHGLEQISRAEERGRITVSFEEKALHVVLIKHCCLACSCDFTEIITELTLLWIFTLQQSLFGQFTH